MKPYRDKEILATIELALSCSKRGNKNHLKDIIAFHKNYTFDLKRQILKKDEVQILLTPIQTKLIKILISNLNVTLSSEYLCESIWQQVRSINTLRSLIYRTNKSLNYELIKNTKGVGYTILSS